MDEAVQSYIDGIDQAHRGLFDRVHELIMAAYPDAAVGISYRIPVYRVGRGRLYVGTWKHGVSIYGWPQGSEAALVERHPALKTSKGTIRLRPQDATSVTDEELLELVHAALGSTTRGSEEVHLDLDDRQARQADDEPSASRNSANQGRNARGLACEADPGIRPRRRRDRNMTSEPLKFGLVGTGYWARVAHAPALASADGIQLAAVWGRDPRAAAELAAGYHATAYDDVAAFLDAVDAVAFAVPPDVQAPIAVRAARAGKHLLLEKPIALSETGADSLVEAVEAGQVASVVFFTLRFRADLRAWLADVNSQGGWTGAGAVWLGSSLLGSSPFNTPWRRDKGALWDLGPHAVSLLSAALGPVTSVIADTGLADTTHLILHHQGGASSTATVSLSAAEAAAGFEAYVWGEPGRSAAPAGTSDPLVPLRTALAELADNARSGRTTHSCDVRFGREVTRVLAGAQRQIEARKPTLNG